MDDGLKTFILEATELLEEMESNLLILEGDPTEQEALNSVFRSIHTIKGSAGVVGVDNVQAFTHKVEFVLDSMRDGRLPVTDALINLLLECRDHVSTLVAEATGQQERAQYTMIEEENLVKQLNAILGEDALAASEATAPEAEPEEEEDEGEGPRAETDNWHISIRFGADVFRNGLDPASFFSYLTRLGDVVSMTTLIDAMPPAGAMNPESCYIGFEVALHSDADRAAIADVFEFVREDCTLHILPPGSRLEKYMEMIASLPESAMRIGEILVESGVLSQKELDEALRMQDQEGGARNLGDILVDEGAVRPEFLTAAAKKQRAQGGGAQARESTSIRVDTGKLDLLINTVGELVIAGAAIKQEAERTRDARLRQSAGVLGRLIEEIRDRSMSVRMIPVYETFNRFNRVVRDIAKDRGKEIALTVTGGETELDRTVIERIKDPLMHIVRNAADHGIEMPEARRAAGKPAQGQLRLHAYQETGDIIIEVSDDGRGLDRHRLLAKAMERGLVQPDESLTDDEVMNLIFEPGFSTAEEVTNISGRGVGMDVVKRNIQALRGTVSLSSTLGQGTTVSIRLPLTLAIIDGFLVSVGDAHYVVPMDMVVECLELTEQGRRDAHGRDHINLRGHILPYVRLRDMFGHTRDRKSDHVHILVVQHAGRLTGLLVDSLHGEVQTVIKSIGKVFREVEGISGATILGDGTVALIVDVPHLVGRALREATARG
jgi:two-component system chemotaxis sensor kinase CheA